MRPIDSEDMVSAAATLLVAVVMVLVLFNVSLAETYNDMDNLVSPEMASYLQANPKTTLTEYDVE